MKGKIERGCEQVQMSIVASRQFPFFEQVDLSDPLCSISAMFNSVRERRSGGGSGRESALWEGGVSQVRDIWLWLKRVLWLISK